MKFLQNTLLVAVLSALSISVQAATANGNFVADATIGSTCTVAAENVVFGSFAPNTTGADNKSAVVTSRCSNGVSYSLTLSSGSSGNAAVRSMSGATVGNTDKLTYTVTEGMKPDLTSVAAFNGSLIPGLIGTGLDQTSYYVMNLQYNQFITPDYYVDDLTVSLDY